MHKHINTGYGKFLITVEFTSSKQGQLKYNNIVLLQGTQSKVKKAFDGLSSGRLVNMLRAKGVINE